MKYPVALSLLVLSVVFACTPSPQEIHYGEDACHSCLMTIVDERHAAELVTSKGKVFKFDAIECMVRHMKEAKGQEYAHVLVCDYEHPRTLIDADVATYLISPSIPSPMGAFLSAFSTREAATMMQKSAKEREGVGEDDVTTKYAKKREGIIEEDVTTRNTKEREGVGDDVTTKNTKEHEGIIEDDVTTKYAKEREGIIEKDGQIYDWKSIQQVINQ